jgi:hypothetical protein
MSDDALIAAIPDSQLGESSLLAAEAARRQLEAAVPALAALWRRFTGFGEQRLLPEQAAVLEGLVAIGGRAAAAAVAQIIDRGGVSGAALKAAVRAGAYLRAHLSAVSVHKLLRHPDAEIRAHACRCAHPQPETIALLIECLGEPESRVFHAAACALGRMQRAEAQPALKRLLRQSPSQEVIDAAASIADDECIVLIGRIARMNAVLAEAALDALEDVDNDRANAIVAALRRKSQLR